MILYNISMPCLTTSCWFPAPFFFGSRASGFDAGDETVILFLAHWRWWYPNSWMVSAGENAIVRNDDETRGTPMTQESSKYQKKMGLKATNMEVRPRCYRNIQRLSNGWRLYEDLRLCTSLSNMDQLMGTDSCSTTYDALGCSSSEQ